MTFGIGLKDSNEIVEEVSVDLVETQAVEVLGVETESREACCCMFGLTDGVFSRVSFHTFSLAPSEIEYACSGIFWGL